MHTPATFELELEDLRLPVRVERTGSTRSPHTGHSLLEIHAAATTTDPNLHPRLTGLLRDASHHPVRLAERWNGVGRWHLSWNSYAEAAGEHTYRLILQEEEELRLESLVVDGVELHPYEYRERFSGDELTIWAKVVERKTDVFRLRTLLRTRHAFPVVRRGIRDEPRPMRFGVAEWSEHEGQIKFRLVLVDEGADPAEHPELVRIEEQNARSALGYYMNFVERLAELMERSGVASAEQIEAARDAARDEPWGTRREFWRVPDVDLL